MEPDLDPRRRLLLAGPSLADVDAALACPCGCHPKVVDLHHGGTDCPCQLTDEERRTRAEKSLEDLRRAFAPIAEANRSAETDMAALADELGVDARVACSMCPLAVTGHCDGHAFYLRERHGEYRVTVSVEPSTADLWTAGDEVPYVDVATGSDADIYDADDHPYSAALRVAVTAVRDWLNRAACDHAHRGDRTFCPDCGERGPTTP